MVVYKNPKCIFRNTKMVCRNTNPDRYKYKRCVFYSVDKGFSEKGNADFNCELLTSVFGQFQMTIPRFERKVLLSCSKQVKSVDEG